MSIDVPDEEIAARLDGVELLAMGVSHEINNINGFIRVNAENAKGIIDRFELSEDGFGIVSSSGPLAIEGFRTHLVRSIQGILEATLRLQDVTAHLRDCGKQNFEDAGPVDLQAVVDGAVAISRAYVEKVAALVVEESGAPAEVEGIRYELEHVLLNLVKNAYHAVAVRAESEPDDFEGRIIVRLRRSHSQSEYEIEVEDNGCGISPQNLKKIFLPYFTTKKRGDGTGLGLSILFAIVERHYGTIRARSDIGVGTIFTLSLPELKLEKEMSDE